MARAIRVIAALTAFLAAVPVVAAPPRDEPKQAAAQTLIAEADRLVADGTAASYKTAIMLYEKALGEVRAAGDLWWEGQTLHKTGYAYMGLREYQKAVLRYQQAVQIWERLADRIALARTFDAIGEAYVNARVARDALEYLTRALPIWESTGDRSGEAKTLTSVGEAHYLLGDNRKALDYMSRALSIQQELGDVYGEVLTSQNIGMIHLYLGDGRAAVDYLTHAVSRNRDRNDHRFDAHLLNNLARSHAALGERQQALDRYVGSLALWQQVDDRWGEALTLGNIGRTYEEMGQDDQALDRYKQALAIFRTSGDAGLEGGTLEQIGQVHARAGRTSLAIEYLRQALSLVGNDRDPHRESDALLALGGVYATLRQHRKAITIYERALSIKRARGDRRGEAQTLHGLGEVYVSLRHHGKAVDWYQQALAHRRAIGDRDGEAASLAALARVERDRGNLAEARSLAEQAVEIVESLRVNVISQEFRTSYAAARQGYYDLYINLLMREHDQAPTNGYDVLAFETSERARARSLVESLAEAREDIRTGVDRALVDRERELQQALNAKEQYRLRLMSAKATRDQIEAAETEVRSLVAAYQDLQARIRASSPRYAALTQPLPLRVVDIQRRLDPGTLLLEYSLGDERSFLWIVSTTSMTSFVLPKRATLETDAKRLHALLRGGASRVAQGQSRAALAKVGRRVLGPAVHHLKRANRLLIVADGALQYVPFSALVLSEDPPARPLVSSYEIVHLPSASALAQLARDIPNDHTASRIAVFADPVFDARDERLTRRGRRGTFVTNRRQSKPAMSSVERSARDSGAVLQRLPFSRHEADAIVAAAGEPDVYQALDFSASRATLTSLDLAKYRVVHFATHALINSRYPELSGIILSLIDEQGRPQDGFLRVHEIYNLKLSADLVVLSACQTALGKEVRGEGIIGLTRAFMYAGAPRVVVSLWNVNDEATAELMKRFYRAMFVDRLRPPAALRAAQRSLSRESRWQAPYYWAGFVLQGDWK